MNILTKCQLNSAIALLLLSGMSAASAQELDCKTLKDAIAQSEQNFSAFRGARRNLPPDPELAKLQGVKGFNYKRDEYATSRRLAAAVNCSVIVARADDPESIISEARYQCVWPSTGKAEAQFVAISKAIQACRISAQAEENDSESYTLHINRVESGEGWGGVSVSADRQSASTDAGASVSVIHAVCQAKTPGGCDDAD